MLFNPPNPIKYFASDSSPPTRQTQPTGLVISRGLNVPLRYARQTTRIFRVSCLGVSTRCIVMGKGRMWYMGPYVAQALPACHEPQQQNNVCPIPNSLDESKFHLLREPFARNFHSMPCDGLLRYQGLLPTWLHHML